MYNTEKNPGFNVKDVIIKAIFLVLFIYTRGISLIATPSVGYIK